MTGSIVGTPHYMSPEQVQGQPVDGRSDQFSLAVIAYEMLTGEKPYTGEHLTTVVYKIVAEEPVLPHRLNPSLSAAIENVLRKALSKKPDARYRNCQEFIESLEKACSASKGWKLMPRGGLLNAMTMADVKAPTAMAAAAAAPSLPPPRRKSRSDAGHAPRARSSGSRDSRVSCWAILVAAGFLALLGWQAAPWLMPGSQPAGHRGASAAAAKEESPAPDHAGSAPVDPAGRFAARRQAESDGQALPPGGSGAAPKPDAAKTEPELPLRPELEASEPAEACGPPSQIERRPPVSARAGAPQEVLLTSSPAGATATLDGNPSMSCTTPCSLTAAPGKHTVAMILSGYRH